MTISDVVLSDSGLIRTSSFIDGEWSELGALGSFDVIDPATGLVVARCADSGPADAERAVEAAFRAFADWRHASVDTRVAVLWRIYELLKQHEAVLARLITVEQGKPLRDAAGEVAYAASYFRWFAEEAKRMNGEVLASPWTDRRLLTIQQPVGVVAAVTPWNFPLAMIARKVAPAIAAGCTVVVKPAEDTPLTALALAGLIEQAGMPAGVYNTVVCSTPDDVGRVLSTDDRVRKITFTGSTEVGKVLLGQAAGTVKHVSMELGGNAPFLVFEDADLDRAVTGALASKFRHGGQTCICANRFLVHESLHDEFVARLSARCEELCIGSGLDEQSDIGPVINGRALERLCRLIEDASRDAGSIRRFGKTPEGGGTFAPVAVLAGLACSSAVFRTEIFGPVAAVYPFRDESEGISLANDSHHGLAGYVYTENAARAWRMAEAMECGMVGVNEVGITGEMIPFGGIKQSGIGREGSSAGLSEYTETKYVCFGGLD